MKYNHKKIEKKWAKKWDYRAEDFSEKPKKYIMIEFPYPSGDGLHVGHVRSYSALDAMARKKRMEGFNVLYPIGWDAFGLPTENYAIKKGIHPKIVTEKNIANFKKQLKSLGLSFDWSREINTTDPEYYKWTQWIFLQFFKKGLAYQKEMPINWCPSCKIGLANEEVIEGKCERCGQQTEKRNIKQWLLKITEYAEKLLDGLKEVDYLDKIRIQQENWIGKSEGAEVQFKINGEKITVFTTRPDTLFGATYFVLSPEHPLVEKIVTSDNKDKILKYKATSKKKSDLERTELQKEKTGEFTGAYAKNPVNGEKIPVWIADYVLINYGTGAIMAVPAHDDRDWQFAKKYDLPIREVLKGGDISKEPFIGEGIHVNSKFLDGLYKNEAIKKMIDWLTKNNVGKKAVNYKLRDWIFSRQHYWGEPIPIIHCSKCGAVEVPEKDLPVELPYVERYEPTDTGESPLASIKEWVNTVCPKCGEPAKRETDTMPNWAGSSWYFLRYIDPKNSKEFASQDKLNYWMPVDLYNGGMEHTVLHLLYSRFWHKFLYDLGLVPTSEPYAARRSHGMVLAEDGRKMSKSWGNVINPDEVIEKVGADSLRVYEMFMGPFGQAISWSTDGLIGANRFLNKIWRLKDKVVKEANNNLESLTHQTIKKVTEDIDSMKFNTAIAQLMILVNAMEKKPKLQVTSYKLLVIMLAPFAPFLAEELWSSFAEATEDIEEKKKYQESVHNQNWPKYDPKKIEEDEIELVVQINGKFRGSIKAPKGISQKKVEEKVMADSRFKKYMENKIIKKIVFVPDKLINFVFN